MSNRQIIYSRGTVTKLANALQLSRNTVTKALLGAYFDDPYGNMERVRTTAINQYGCKYAGRVIGNGTEESN